MNKKFILIGIAVLIICLQLSGCTDSENKANPEGEIISGYTSSNMDVNSFVIYVNFTVKNVGDSGNLEVFAYVRQGITDESKHQTLYFKSGETKDISFAFSEKFKLGSSWFHDFGVSAAD